MWIPALGGGRKNTVRKCRDAEEGEPSGTAESKVGVKKGKVGGHQVNW
jgi:hypothetical protein